MEISKLQYITPDYSNIQDFDKVINLCQNGLDWVQLRFKDKPENFIVECISHVLDGVEGLGIKIILNDYVHWAKEFDLDGVHLGQSDMSIIEAREILGPNKIIGGTANTINEVVSLSQLSTDYIGLGPYNFTETKKVLSPILGVSGYGKILEKIKYAEIDLPPVIAIGGIQIENILELLNVGVHGIATSSLIASASNPSQIIGDVKKILSNQFEIIGNE